MFIFHYGKNYLFAFIVGHKYFCALSRLKAVFYVEL